MIAEAFKFITERAAPLANDVVCKYGQQSGLVLLAGIFLKLGKMAQTMTFGANKWSITPFTLDTTPKKILEKDINGLVRKISVWVDSASGGPTPTIRVGGSATSANGGGVRVSAGQVNEIGEVPPGTELWAASSTSIAVYVLERA